MANLAISQRTIRNATEKTGEVLTDAADIMSDYVDDARDWLQKNYGKALGGVALIAAAGVIGYFFGRNAERKD